MINSQNLITKICDKINLGGLTSLETCQTDNALTILNSPVKCVASFANLPSVTDYAGRMIYVGDENRYYVAVNGFWLNNLDSEIFNYASIAYSWGYNGNGRLGLGITDTARCSSPSVVVGEFIDWCQVSAGERHSLGLRTNGTLWAWGYNTQGRLGDGTQTIRNSPVSVVGGFTDWCRISAGWNHSLALRANGTVWAWGVGTYGRLGNDSTGYRTSPVSVVGGFTDWCQVSAGERHSLGVRTNGTAWAWGNNTSGRFGDNTTINRSSPVSVVGGFTDWCQVSTGCSHSLGVRTNGTAWAWGDNGQGRLGDDSTIARSSPVSIVGGFTDWCQVSSKDRHSLGLRSNGTAWAWGYNSNGQLGDGTNITRSSPVSVVGGFTDWCLVSAGNCHSLGVRTNGTAWAWGCNGCGRLGDNTVTNRTSPVEVCSPNNSTGWSNASAGRYHSLGVFQACIGF
jgi:alpha-tubulin suppressor-like RCC1 family protein